MEIAILINLCFIGFVLFLVSMSIYGVYLAFKESIILGFIVLFLEPIALIFGLAKVLFKYNIPKKILSEIKENKNENQI